MFFACGIWSSGCLARLAPAVSPGNNPLSNYIIFLLMHATNEVNKMLLLLRRTAFVSAVSPYNAGCVCLNILF